MKKLVLFLIAFKTFTFSSAQEYKSFEIENITKEVAWSAVIQTFKEQKLPVPSLYKTTVKSETGFYKYTSMMIQNRLRFLVQYESGKLIISITERQYLTDKGWADNLLPISKKQASKILDPIRDRIIELTNDKVNVGNASIAPMVQKTETVNAAVINYTNNQSQSINLQDGLILKYPFNGSATDVSGHRHNGTVNGAQLVNDRFGNEFSAYSFNGISDFIFVPEDVYFDGDFTISVWINPRQIRSWNRILDFGNSENAQNVFLAISQSESGKPVGSVFGPHGRIFTEITSNSIIPLNRWSHIVFLLQGSIAKLYLNRELVAIKQNCIIPPSVKRGKNYIGRSNWQQDGYTNATIDDITIFSRAINEAEIEALFYEGDNSQILLSADFENPVLHEWIKKTSTGTFINSPGVKNTTSLTPANVSIFQSGNGVYDFGLSTCDASCYNQYTSTLGLMLPDTEYITSISFKDFELGQNWGSKGEIKLDGKILEDFEFGKKPNNDKKTDTSCRQHSIFIGERISKIEFVVSDITKLSESLLDDLVIRYKIREPEKKPQVHKRKQASKTKPVEINPDTIPLPTIDILEDTTIYTTECEKSLSDRDAIICLAYEAMDIIKRNEDKIKNLEQAAGLIINQNKKEIDPRFMEIVAEIDNLKDSSKKIRAEYANKINKIAKKRTINFMTVKSDTARYYSDPLFKVVGAHWNRKELTILLGISFKPQKSIIEDDNFGVKRRYYQNVSEFRCELIDNDDKTSSKITFPSVASDGVGIFFHTFEKLNMIDIKASLSSLTSVEN
jgi:hypothetical protein